MVPALCIIIWTLDSGLLTFFSCLWDSQRRGFFSCAPFVPLLFRGALAFSLRAKGQKLISQMHKRQQFSGTPARKCNRGYENRFLSLAYFCFIFCVISFYSYLTKNKNKVCLGLSKLQARDTQDAKGNKNATVQIRTTFALSYRH